MNEGVANFVNKILQLGHRMYVIYLRTFKMAIMGLKTT